LKESYSSLYAWMIAIAILYVGILLSPLPYWLMYVGPMVGGLALLALAFQLKIRLGTVTADPETAMTDLVHRLRSTRFRVEQTDDNFVAQVDSLSAIRIRMLSSTSGTVVTYRMEGTPAGWVVILILVFSGFPMIIVIPIVMFMLMKVRRFAKEQVVPWMTAPSVPQQDSMSVMIRLALVDSLSEGHRLSSEAYEAEKSNYEDKVIVLAMLGLAVLLGLTAAIYTIVPGTASEKLLVSILVPIAISSAFTLVTVRSLRRRTRPRLDELRGWVERLDDSMAKLTTSAKPHDPETSLFELLSDAWRNVPSWLEIRRHSSLYREHGTWLLMVALSLLSAFGFVFAIFAFDYDPRVGLVLGAASITTLCAVWVLHKRLTRRLEEERAHVLSDWNRRLATINHRMETHLQEL